MHPDESVRQFLQVDRRLITFGHPILDIRSPEPLKEPFAIEFLTRFTTDDGMRSVGTLLHSGKMKGQGRLMLDLHCLEATFKVLSRWDQGQRAMPRYFFLNMEPDLLDSQLLWDNMPTWLGMLPVHPGRLVFEITEHYLTDLGRMTELIARLRSHGVKVAVDDLGSGSASLNALTRFEPNFMKLDKSLVENARVHQGSTIQNALLKALATFAREAGIGLIAEGIETREELQVVAGADIHYVQGFIFGQPHHIEHGGTDA